jgi:hypothetical protein
MLNACLTREKRSLMGRTRGWLKDRSRAVLCVPIVVLAVLLLGGPVSVFAVSATTAPETTGIPWTRQFGTPSSDFASAISATADGAFVAGDTLGTLPGETSAGDDDAFVRRYNADGDVLWTRQFGTESYETAWAVSTTADGVYVAGESGGALSGETNAGKSDAFVRRYNADGDVLWTRQFGTAGYDSAFAIAATADGVYVAGNTRRALPGETSAGGYDAFVRRYNADGDVMWTRQFGSPSTDEAFAVAATADGIYVAGDTFGALPGETSAGGYDAFVRRYNADGDVLWTRQFGSPSTDEASSISAHADGIYVAGITGGSLLGETSGSFKAFVRRYNADGDVLWTRQFGPSTDVSSYISATEDSIYVAGNTRGTLPGQTKAGRRDAFIRRIVLYHPDALISRAANKGFVGNNIYNDSGARQSRSTRVTPRATRTFYLRVENDGDASHPIALQGCQDKRGFAVRYLRGAAGTTDITTEVIAGTYAPRIAPWKSVMVRLVIKVKAAAEAGARITCRVTVTSEPADDHNDTVRAKVKVS